MSPAARLAAYTGLEYGARRAVRSAWAEVIRERSRFTLRAAPDQGQLFTPLFEYAERLAEGAAWEPGAGAAFVRETVRGYLGEGTQGEAAY